jgi:hypothetical protein
LKNDIFRGKMSGKHLICFLFLLLFSEINAYGRENQWNECSNRDFFRHECDDSMYTENWTAIIRDDSGSVLYINFLYSNIGVFKGNTGVNVSFTPADGKAININTEYSTDDYRENRTEGRISIKNSYVVMKNNKDAEIHVRMENCSVDLALNGWKPGIKFHNGRLWISREDHEFLDYFFHIPAGEVTGKISISGRTADIKGRGYFDHSAKNVNAPDFSDRWHTLRLWTNDYAVSMMDIVFNEDHGKKRVTYLIFEDRSGIVSAGISLIHPSLSSYKQDDDYRYPTSFKIDLAAENLKLSVSTTLKKLHEKVKILDQLSWAARQVVKAFAGNPVIYRMIVDFQMNVERDNNKIAESGAALAEVICLK